MSLWLKIIADKSYPQENTPYTSQNEKSKDDLSLGGVITPSEPTVGEKPQSEYGQVSTDRVLDKMGEPLTDRNNRVQSVSPCWLDPTESKVVPYDSPEAPGDPFGYK